METSSPTCSSRGDALIHTSILNEHLSGSPGSPRYPNEEAFNLEKFECLVKICQPPETSVDQSCAETVKDALMRLARLFEDKSSIRRGKSCQDNLLSQSDNEEHQLSQSDDGFSMECLAPANQSYQSLSDSEVSDEEEIKVLNEEDISIVQEPSSTSGLMPETHAVKSENTIANSFRSIVHNKTYTKTLTMGKKEICLQNWTLRITRNKTAVQVEGELTEIPDSYFLTHAISKRINENKIKSVSGKVYVLIGPIDRSSMKEAGFPSHFIKKFMHGFPKKWKQYIDDHLQELRAFEKEKKYKFDQQETDKPVFERRMKKRATSEGPGMEINSKSAGTKNDYFDDSKCAGNPIMPRATRLNMFFTHQRNKILPLNLGCGNHTNFDNQMNMMGQRCCVSKEASTAKSECTQENSPQKITNSENTVTESIFKEPRRGQKNKIKDTTQELIKPSDTRASREEFPSDTERMKCKNKTEKKLSAILTPTKSRKTLAQKWKDQNSSNNTQRECSEKTENVGKKADLTKNKNNRLEENGACASATINHKSKIPSPQKEKNSVDDSDKKIRKALRLKRSESFGNFLPHKIQTKLRGNCNQQRKMSSIEVMESETKEEPLERFRDLFKRNNWTEKGLQNFQRAMSSMPKEKHGFQLMVATAMGLRKAEESQKKHMEEAQRKRGMKKMVPSAKASNGVNRKQPRTGRLKRREEMRRFQEQLPDDCYEDDDDDNDDDNMFAGSTLLNKSIRLPDFEGNQDDDFLYRDRDSSTSSSDIYALANTSRYQHVSPDMLESLNRRDCDKLYQMKRENKSHRGMWTNVKKKLVGSNTSPAPRKRRVNRGIRFDIENFFSCITKQNFRRGEEEKEEEEDDDDIDSDFAD